MARKFGFLALLALLAASVGTLAQQYDEYDYGYGYDFYNSEDDFSDDLGGGGMGGGSSSGSSSSGSSSSGSTNAGADKSKDLKYDEYGYYGDEDEQYYEYYGYYAEDKSSGEDDYYSDEYDFFEECSTDSTGKAVLANGTASCDMKITGADKHADKLPGGLDGVYKLSTCYNGKGLYKRANSPATESRVLWYSSTFGDWDISKGNDPNEAEILMYGGEMEHASVPLFVNNWHLGADLKSNSNMSQTDYMSINISVTCANGKKYDRATYNQGTQGKLIGPALTDAEMLLKYEKLYYETSRPNPSPTLNFGFVVLLVMVGLTIVLAIPYFLLKKKGAKGEKGGVSFAQLLQQSKKKSSGHIN